jgi:hypothetical protein
MSAFATRSAPDERHRDGRRLAAAVAVDGGVRGQDLDERLRVALLPGGEEAAGDLVPLLAREIEAAPALLHVPVGASEDLAAVVGALADDAGHLIVGMVEDLAHLTAGARRAQLIDREPRRNRRA